MTLPNEKSEIINEKIKDIIQDVEYIDEIIEQFEDAEDYNKNASRDKKLATERIVTGLRQHMVNVCREILEYEIGMKPDKRKAAVEMCIDNGYIRSGQEYTDAFSFGEATAKVYGRDVDDIKLYNGIVGLPKIYRKFCRDLADYLDKNT